MKSDRVPVLPWHKDSLVKKTSSVSHMGNCKQQTWKFSDILAKAEELFFIILLTVNTGDALEG